MARIVIYIYTPDIYDWLTICNNVDIRVYGGFIVLFQIGSGIDLHKRPKPFSRTPSASQVDPRGKILCFHPINVTLFETKL